MKRPERRIRVRKEIDGGQGSDEKEQGSAQAQEGEGEDHRRQPAAQPPGASQEQLVGRLAVKDLA